MGRRYRVLHHTKTVHVGWARWRVWQGACTTLGVPGTQEGEGGEECQARAISKKKRAGGEGQCVRRFLIDMLVVAGVVLRKNSFFTATSLRTSSRTKRSFGVSRS